MVPIYDLFETDCNDPGPPAFWTHANHARISFCLLTFLANNISTDRHTRVNEAFAQNGTPSCDCSPFVHKFVILKHDLFKWIQSAFKIPPIRSYIDNPKCECIIKYWKFKKIATCHLSKLAPKILKKKKKRKKKTNIIIKFEVPIIMWSNEKWLKVT